MVPQKDRKTPPLVLAALLAPTPALMMMDVSNAVQGGGVQLWHPTTMIQMTARFVPQCAIYSNAPITFFLFGIA
jgi:hypothetical protein